jgi:hypothetical protein
MLGGWRRLHNEELRNLHVSPNIISNEIKEDKMGATYSMNGIDTNVYNILVGNLKGKGNPEDQW